MTEEVSKYINEVEIPMQNIFKDMLKYAPSKFFGLLGNAVIVPIYTNLLSPTQYGVYAISLAVLSFLCILFSDWIGLAGLRFFRQNQLNEQVPRYLSTLIMVLIFNLVFMYVLCFLFKNNFYEYFSVTPKVFLFILLLIIPASVRALLFQVLRAQIKPGAFTFSTIINQILTISLAVYFIKNCNLGAIAILLGMAISISLIDVILIFQTKISSHFKLKLPDMNLSKSIFAYGFPIAVASISIWVINQSNKFITSHYYGLDTAGFVGVAYNLTFPLLMTLFAIITIAAYPRIINLYEDNIDVRPVVSKLTGYFLLISLPIATIMSLYSKDIIALFANIQYQSAGILIPFFAFGALFLSFTDFTTYQYHLSKKTYILTIIKIVSAIIGLILNIILIKQLGLVGVGIATLISNILYFILTIVVKIHNLGWQPPYKRITHIALCFIPTILLWSCIKNSTILPLLQINILLIIYYGTFYSTKNYFKEFFTKIS